MKDLDMESQNDNSGRGLNDEDMEHVLGCSLHDSTTGQGLNEDDDEGVVASEGPSRVHEEIVVEDVDSEDEDVRQSEDVTEMFMTDNGSLLLNWEG